MNASPKPRRTRNSVPVAAGQSKEAKKTAAAILEVLAGLRTPLQAAEALAISLPGYYQRETRGLRGLLDACEPKPRGRQVDPGKGMATLGLENQRLKQEIGRQQTLVRAAQRAVGLGVPPPPPPKPAGGKGRRRKPAVRALSLAAKLKKEAEAAESIPTATPP
jgi:hypothetical protein